MLDQPSAQFGTDPRTSILDAARALSRELGAVRRDADPGISARLAAAEDELAAIQDEITQQQQEVAELQAGAGNGPAAVMRRFVAVLPVATLLTNANGQILEANPAAHEAIRVPQGELPGKPIFVYIAPDYRQELRSALGRTATDDDLIQVMVNLTPRRGISVPAHLALVREVGDDGVRWVILPDGTAGTPPTNEQLEALTRLCRLGVTGPPGHDLRSILTQVVRLCRQAIVEADEVSLFVGDPQEPTLAVATSAAAQHLDGLQHVRSAGPSVGAYRSGNPVALGTAAVATDPGLRDDPRAAAVTSALAVPLLVDELSCGVLTLYALHSPDLATLAALRQVMPFVEAAQSLIRDTRAQDELRRTQRQLETALTSRAVIDQAKGMLMAELKCDAERAFQLLVRLSGTRNQKVREVAQGMVDEIAGVSPAT